MAKLRISCDAANVSMTATLNASETARRLLKALPTEGKAQTWGEEVYFEVPVQMDEENSHSTVPSGTIAYWPPGRAFCIFFGQTPYSPVNLLGRLDGDANYFGRVRSGDVVRLEAVKEA